MHALIPHHIHAIREADAQFELELEAQDLAGVPGGLVASRDKKLQRVHGCDKLHL